MAGDPVQNISHILKKKGTAEELSANQCLTKMQYRTRRSLSTQFSDTNTTTQQGSSMILRSRHVLTSISNLNVGNVPKETRKLINAGAEKVNQTLRDVRVTIGTWSQRLKNPTRRRQRLLQGSPYTPTQSTKKTCSPRSKKLLGRTPTKLYSPFGIETPSNKKERQMQKFYGTRGTYTPRSKQKNLATTFDPSNMYSPTRVKSA